MAVIRVAQGLGVSLEEAGRALEALPHGGPPTAQDWERLSTQWRDALNLRIAQLEALRDELGECIGCGCLSLTACGLFNRNDKAAARGTGPRYLLGDRSRSIPEVENDVIE